jgi:hypothetical protein
MRAATINASIDEGSGVASLGVGKGLGTAAWGVQDVAARARVNTRARYLKVT